MSQDKTAPPKPAPGGTLLDPFDMWRKALTELEQRTNELGNQSMRSPEMMQLMHQFAAYSSQYQNVLDQVLTRCLKALNLPSRREIAELGDLMRRIDEKLDRLLPAAEPASIPRPARTRRPSSEVEASSLARSAEAAQAEAGAEPLAEAAPAAASVSVAASPEAAELATPATSRRRAPRSRAPAPKPAPRTPRKSRRQE